MIYISSSCVKERHIGKAVEFLAKRNIKNIELSGGTEYYPHMIDDLFELKNKYALNYVLHNYFPPPITPFVLNLSSSIQDIRNNSIEHIRRAVELSRILGTGKYGFHAGYLINPEVKELGEKITKKQLIELSVGLKNFKNAYRELTAEFPEFDFFVENNVINYQNFKEFGKNPFLLTTKNDYISLKQDLDFNLILDIAHLKVSCNTLQIGFFNELSFLVKKTNYIHLSDNDGYADSNKAIRRDSELYELLCELPLANKHLTLEIYEDIDKVLTSYDLVEELVKKQKAK